MFFLFSVSRSTQPLSFFDPKAKVVKRDDLPSKNTFEHLPTFFVFNIFPVISTSDGDDREAKGLCKTTVKSSFYHSPVCL